jgi:hypothetical protein
VNLLVLRRCDLPSANIRQKFTTSRPLTATEVLLHWDDAKQQLTIGARRGRFATLPKELVFKPVVVGEGQSVGSLTEPPGDARIQYTGQEVKWHK